MTGSTDGVYPYQCADGFRGNSNATAFQSTQQCNGACPAGYYCSSEHAEPQRCSPGTYCPAASASEKQCPRGTYSDEWGLHSQDDCDACPPGFFCESGTRWACPRNTYVSTNFSGSMDDCIDCPTEAVTQSTGATSLSACQCDVGHYDRFENASCVACPDIGASCLVSGLSLERLPIEQGYYRASPRSTIVKRCPSAADENTGCVGGNVTGPEGGPCESSLAVRTA